MATSTSSEAGTELSRHERYLAQQSEDPAFKAQFDRRLHEIEAIDAVVHRLDDLRVSSGITKAELARRIDRNPAAVRRLLSVAGNPELRTVIAMAEALDAEVKIVPKSRSTRRPAKRPSAV